MGSKCVLVVAGLAASLAGAASADQVTVTPSADVTLCEDAAGMLANGKGQYIFAGMTALPSIRRAALRFDLSAIPAGSTVQSAELRLTLSRAAGFQSTFAVSLQRVTTGWTEGPSMPEGDEGTGVQSLPGDTTWIHTFFDTQRWTTAGGDFVPAVSATLMIPDQPIPQAYTWGSTATMVADVQGWVNAPAANFGWMLVGDESASGTARRFDSRQNLDSQTWPTLIVNYSPPIGPGCYPNCDQSTQVPFLNVADFTCFLQKFASADSYANCDGSTQAPVLNVADFTCFLQKFAAGCSAP